MASTASVAGPNTTALPDRRAFLSTIAGAGALGLPVLPALAATPHLDAELLELEAQLVEATARAVELGEQGDEAYERFVPPPMPEPLFWRRTDHLVVWVDRKRLDSVGRTDDGSERYTYASDGVLQSLKNRRAEWLAVEPIELMVGDRTMARVEEIIAHLEAYKVEEAKRLDACGYTAIDKAEKAQSAHVEALRLRIATTPARTPEGVCVKVRASLQEHGETFCEQHYYERLLETAEVRRSDTTRLLALSSQLDAARLGGASSGDRRAA